MNPKRVIMFLICGLAAAGLLFASPAPGEEPKLFIPDKALCAKMLQHGKEAYMRGKYLDAKAYFRKAVQADPASDVAWKYYDQAAIFALAERVEQDAGLILPGTSTRGETAGGPTPPPPAPAAPKKSGGFKIVDDEGC